MIDMTQRISDLELLHPAVGMKFRELARSLEAAYATGRTKTLFMTFETYRTPHRQRFLNRTNPSATKASAFQSAHQFGMAVDFVAFDVEHSKWSWDEHHDWAFLKAEAEAYKLTVPIGWDRVHVEAPLFQAIAYELRGHMRVRS